MLYPIRLPKAKRHLEWIVKLQHTLIKAVCSKDVSPNEINRTWLIKVLPDVSMSWVVKFSNWKFKNKTVLENLASIASLDQNVKTNLLADFEHDLRIHRIYTSYTDPHALYGLRALDSDSEAKAAVKELLERFYTSNIYKSKGYKITKSSGQVMTFNKDTYLGGFGKGTPVDSNSFAGANASLYVCPFCDGEYEQMELDHYFRKALFPGLSCHPLNLIPICGTCNSGEHKGRKDVFSAEGADAFADWLHPYLRSAAGKFTIQIGFSDNRLTPKLAAKNDSSQVQRQLDNHASLINLDTRWQNFLERKVRITQKKIHGFRRELGRPPTETELLDKIIEWKKVSLVERGIESHSMLETAYLREAQCKNPDIFCELWKYSQDTRGLG